MGTNGTVVYVVEGESKAQYVHNDSSPDTLGVSLLKWLKKAHADEATYEAVRALKVVPPNPPEPTFEEQQRLRPYADLGVSYQSLEDWYCLLRNCQGDPAATLESGYIYGAGHVSGFYTYTVDFDAKTFTAAEGSGEVLGRWPFTDLPKKGAFLRTTTSDEDSE